MKIDLWHGDCLELMKKIPDGSIDAVITDPPYGTTACKWDCVIPFDLMWKELNRIIKPNGAIVLFGAQPFTSSLIMSNVEMFKYSLIWQKEKPTNFFQLKKRIGNVTEDIAIFYKNQPTFNPQMVKHEGGLVKNSPKGNHNSILTGKNKKVLPYNDTGFRYPNNILKFNRVKLGSNLHPTQKPTELIEYLVKTYSNENDTILDFTMGSGTTGVACKNLNRNFIGIELDDNYFKIAKERIENS